MIYMCSIYNIKLNCTRNQCITYVHPCCTHTYYICICKKTINDIFPHQQKRRITYSTTWKIVHSIIFFFSWKFDKSFWFHHFEQNENGTDERKNNHLFVWYFFIGFIVSFFMSPHFDKKKKVKSFNWNMFRSQEAVCRQSHIDKWRPLTWGQMVSVFLTKLAKL